MKPDFETTTQARYQHLRELGRGKNTRVDLVYDHVRQLTLARKTWEVANTELRFRLRQQHRRALSVTHPNIAKLYDLIANNDETALTMEAVHGSDVGTYLQKVAARDLGDGARLGAALHLLQQLKLAIQALHAADIVHRDIKPRNVLVEEVGTRLVLLDAGFSWPAPDSPAGDSERAQAELLPYLAPECLRGTLHSVEGDWYSFGAVAAYWLCGRAPFAGTLEEVLRAKDAPIESLRDHYSELPVELDELICALLSRDPRARPGFDDVDEVLSALTHSHPFLGESAPSDPPPSKPSHVQLKAAAPTRLDPTPGDQPKARELEQQLAPEPQLAPELRPPQPAQPLLPPQTVVLDDLSNEVAFVEPHRPDPERPERHTFQPPKGAPEEFHESLLGGDVADELAELIDDVVRTFSVAEPPSPQPIQANAAAQPAGPGSAITKLCAQIEAALSDVHAVSLLCVHSQYPASRRRLVAELQSTLPGIVASTRAKATAPALSALRHLVAQLAERLGQELVPTLQRVEPAQRSALLRLCPELASATDAWLIDACAGNPQQRLIDAHLGLRTLLKELTVRDRVVLLVDDAHQLDADSLAALRALLSTQAPGRLQLVAALDETVATADVFAAMLDGLMDVRSAPRLFELDGLEQRRSRPPQPLSDAPPADLAQRGHETRRFTGEDAVLEAQQASDALALQRAADLLQQTVRHDTNPSSDLLQRTALANCAAGRLRDAAEAWLALARTTADAALAQRFELEAGACFLRAGNEERGMTVMRGVLRNVGLHWPRTPLLMSTVERARALLRQGRPADTHPLLDQTHHQQRFDALWGIAKELVVQAPPIADALCTRALREARDLASPSRLLWALGYEAISEANIGGSFMMRRASSLATEVRALADSSPSAYDLAYAGSVEAILAWCHGDWAHAEQLLRSALQAYACLDAATAQERHVLSGFLIGALEAQGKIEALRERIAEERVAALQTGYRHALASCELSAVGLIELAEDHPLEAIERADALLATYAPNTGFTPLHFQHFVATTQARLYAGHHAQAYQQAEQAWQSIKHTHLAQLDGVAVTVHQLRARAALALALHSSPTQAEALRNQALKLAAQLARSPLTHALAMRHVIEANVAVMCEQSSSAEAHCLRAAELFDVSDMCLLRETARMARGVVGEGVDAKLDAGQSAAFLAQAGVHHAARFVAAWFPSLRSQLLDTSLAH